MKAKLIFVTGNRGKFLEAKKILEDFGIELEQVDLDVTEPQADNLEEVVKKCAEEAFKVIKRSFIIEDSGLFINALNGFPGVYSSYVYKTIGYEGILKLLFGIVDRSAYFMTSLAYVELGGELKIFSGRVDGVITTEARGKNNFGFDPIFKPLGSNLTFAEMSIEEKNKFSHRAKALRAFVSWLLSEKKYES
ncbi:MAG: XTP/dITP diphosphatase [Candidatus Brockarchaeota archaeon]|nr:XTP/dITP diphosphatase [Candidatus Brockarchaeota archaeon]MBO3768351.1 XTP/dITP diphosphatase [Candidatus Brockarchaeota archaeon]